MTAESMALALGGRRAGNRWTARCPAHEDRDPSLSIREASDGKLLVRCYAGCGQAEVIHALRHRGLWPTNDRYQGKIIRLQPHQPTHHARDDEGADRTAAAVLKIWESAQQATKTLVETYLRSRAIDIAPSACLRFHPALRHPSGGHWPAMIALVRGSDNAPMAIHRTFLALNGRNKAPVDKQKMMLGPCQGGAVRLGTAHPKNWLVVAEGIETTLSVMQACRLPGWAALSASGLRGLNLPPEAGKVLICADNDANGTGQLAAREAAKRFQREGRSVSIAMPPMTGMDFNDVLSGNKEEDMVEARHVA